MNRPPLPALIVAAAATILLSSRCAVPIALSLVAEVDSPSAGFDCAWAEMNRLGYSVRDGNRDVGYVTAEKRTSGAAREVWTNEIEFDVITATTFVASGRPSLRIAGKTIAQEIEGRAAGSRVDVDTSDTVTRDAQSIVATCGAGRIAP